MVSVGSVVLILVIAAGFPVVVVQRLVRVEGHADRTAVHEPVFDDGFRAGFQLPDGVGAFKAVVGHEALVLRIAELPAGERRIAVLLCAAAGGEGCRCDLDVAAAQPFLIVGSYEVVAAGEVPRLVMVGKGVPAQRCLGEVQFAVSSSHSSGMSSPCFMMLDSQAPSVENAQQSPVEP